MNVEHIISSGLNEKMCFPTLKLEEINIDFIVGLPQTQRKNDLIRVIVERLTKSTHFIPVKSTYMAEYYARIYIDKF